MSKQIETLVYLGPPTSFSHEAAEELKINNPLYHRIQLLNKPTIAEVCQLVIEGVSQEAIIPIENSTDGPVNDTLKALREYPLKVRLEHLKLIRQSLYYRRDADPSQIKWCISKDSANGQCKQTIPKHLPKAVFAARKSTVAAILEAAENPEMAAIGPRITGRFYHLTEKMIQIDDVHDNPINTTRFWIVSTEDDETPVTGNDKTSLIAQIPDRAGSLFAVLNIFADQEISLAKIKSFGKDGEDVAFLMTLQGHQQEPPLVAALNRLRKQHVRIKMLGSYPQVDFQLPDIPWEFDMEYAVQGLRNEISNGINHNNKTVVAFTLKDRIGALKDALEPFNRFRINLEEIDSLPTGRLGEYIFYLAFENGVSQKQQALDVLSAHCTKMVLL